jgi:hypothetical protein
MSTTRPSLKPILFLSMGLVAAIALVLGYARARRDGHEPASGSRRFEYNQLTLWWEDVPAKIRETTDTSAGPSNIHPDDYVGPDTCVKCHERNHKLWSEHPHRWMNALAQESTVKGDFERASIEYLGGRATFYQTNGRYRMKLERDGRTIVYAIRQTIGSRFFQYYVGVMIEAPSHFGPRYFEDDHVLPFGYWLDQHEWVPTVHVHEELPDDTRPDPFNPEPIADLVEGQRFFTYAAGCNYCHTTFPLGDMLIRNPKVLGKHAPTDLHLSTADYLKVTHQSMIGPLPDTESVDHGRVEQLMNDFAYLEAPDHAVTLGVSCEACHLGCRDHAERKLERPDFAPNSPHLLVGKAVKQTVSDAERRREYVNWACGRCHAGGRPTFANGISTWNSIEYSDAMQGSCYSELTCIDCHNPHQKIGPKWTRTAEQDDASCLKCHQNFNDSDQRAAHTHHAPGSSGDRCLNCHMPRINEGLQDVVRTHTIFSPSDSQMIEANHPNACNLCHLDKPIDWTIDHLQTWYGAAYNEDLLAKNYPQRDAAVGIGWLQSESEAVRLVGAEALTREDSRWALPELIEALDDPYLLNRQFATKGLQQMLDTRLEDFGYRFYMMPQERREAIRRIQEEFSSSAANK